MKKLMMILSCLLSLNAFAGNITQTSLTIENLDPRLEMPSAHGANLIVNSKDKTVTLSLVLGAECPPHAECFVGPIFNNITLPIVSISKDKCNIVHIIAKKDLRTVDGELQQLNVTDNSKNTCFFPEQAITLVEYITDGFDHVNHRGSIQTDSSFIGGELK